MRTPFGTLRSNPPGWFAVKATTMKTQKIGEVAALLAAAVCFGAGELRAGDIPVPVFYVVGDVAADGTVPLAGAEKGKGKIEGSVTSDGEALVFDGTGGRVVFDFDAQSLFGSPFTVSAFVETKSLKGYGDIIQAEQPAGFGFRVSQHVVFSVGGGGSGAWNCLQTPKKSLKIGSMQHVAVTWDGSDIIIYVDGVESARGALAGTPIAKNQIIVGSLGNPQSGHGDFPDFRLSHLAVFDSAFSPEQIQALTQGDAIPVK